VKYYAFEADYGGIKQTAVVAFTKKFVDGSLRGLCYYTRHGYFEVAVFDNIGTINDPKHKPRKVSRVYVKNGVNELEIMNTIIDVVENRPHLLKIGEFFL